jgi:hypothetical protein
VNINVLVRYAILPVLLGYVAYMAILMSVPGDPSVSRHLTGASMMLICPAVLNGVQLYFGRRRLAREEAARWAEALAAFEAEAARISRRIAGDRSDIERGG